MHNMIARILEQERAIRRVLSEDRKVSHLVLKWQDIDVLKSLHKALEPMADFTDALSGDSYVTVSSIKPTLRFIENASTAEPDDTRLTADVKAKIQENFKKRYTSDTAQTILNTTTWLDPRYKTEYLCEEGAKNAAENIKREILELELANERSNENRGDTDNPNAMDESNDGQPPATKKKKTLAKLLGQIKKSSATASTASALTRDAQIDLEMSRYLSAPEVALSADPLQWWSIQAPAYPRLAKLARKYLCICGTSSSSERLFSVAGNIVTAKRSLLKPHKVDMLVFLANNL
jgi:hypothetical protein